MESYKELGTVVELLMPVQEYWQMDSLIKEANYVLASGGSPADVREAYKKVYRVGAKYAVKESERIWLYERIKE